MKRLLLLVCALLGFMACTEEFVEEQSAICIDAPETINVGFEDIETRIQLNEVQKSVWTKGDQVSVFYRSNANQLWRYDGETGARVANLKRVDAGVATREMDRVVVVYPYNDNYYINPSTFNVQASLPAVQSYLKDSYGLESNIMISSEEYNQVALRNVCGWLKLKLTGNGEVVESITLRGNNGEQVAGELYINSMDATAILASDMGNVTEDDGQNATGGAGANLVFDDTILKEVTLDCGAGVELGSEVTSFYISLPPQTFANGFSVDIECDGYKPMTLSTEKELVIERNTIQPMAEATFSSEIRVIANNEIWYTATQKIENSSWTFDTFGANIVSNEWNSYTGKGIITFDSDITTIGINSFYNCNNLTGIILNKSIKSIGNYAFEGCTALTEITIPANVDSIGASFRDCTSLSKIVFEKGESQIRMAAEAFDGVAAALYVDRDIKGYNLSFPFRGAKISSITIGPNMKHINSCVFGYCTELQSLNFDANAQIETIGEYAFAASNIPGEVHIPESVVDIDPTAFALTTGITSFSSSSKYYHQGVYGDLCRDMTLVRYPSERNDAWIIDNNYTKIGSWAYSGCNIETVCVLCDKEIEIGDYAFWQCSNLSNFEPWTSGWKIMVSSIGERVFGETAIEELDFYHSSFKSIYRTFGECKELKTLYLPATLEEIGEQSFEACYNLTSLYIAATTPPTLSNEAFNVVPDELKIYVPFESVTEYRTQWSEFSDRFVAYDFENKMVYDPRVVDLGLSVKWASCNVGANAPEEYGDYFAWGEISPKKEYTEDNCTTYGVPMSDIAGNPAYDAATANWGGNWRMPTKDEIIELRKNCTWEWTSLNGVNGKRVTGPNGNSIFLPAAGFCESSSYYVGSDGYYWSSTPYGNSYFDAYSLYFYYVHGDYYGVTDYDSYLGRSVRPVIE